MSLRSCIALIVLAVVVVSPCCAAKPESGPTWYGFYHMQTSWGGYYMNEVAPGVNVAHIAPWLVTDWTGENGVTGANNLGLKAILEFSDIWIAGRSKEMSTGEPAEAVWRPLLRDLASQLNAVGKNNPNCIAAIELVDEPYSAPEHAVPMQRFLDITKQYFPTIPLFYNYGPWALDPIHSAYDPVLPSGMSYFSFDCYWFSDPNMPESEFRKMVRQDLDRAEFASDGLPIIYITTGAEFGGNVMPPPRYIVWLMEEVKARPSVAGVWWFMYCDVPGDPPLMLGARHFPDSLAKIMEIGARIPKRYQPNVDLGESNDEQGIRLLQPAGGETTAATIAGVECHKPATLADRYFYFDVVDKFIHQAEGTRLFLQVDYYDGEGDIRLRYDSTRGKHGSAERIVLGNTKSWKTKVWELADCYFGNRQSGGADFRLEASPLTAAYVDKVAVSFIPFAPRDTMAPTVPTGISAVSESPTSIRLDWKPSKHDGGIVAYKIFRGSDHIITRSINDFTDTGLTPDTEYTYSIVAYDEAGNESARSASIRARTLTIDTAAPTAPAEVTAEGKTSRSIIVAWAPSKDDRGVAGYKVYRDGVLVGETAVPSYWDNGLKAGTEYSYTVSAYDAGGNESGQSSGAVGARTLKAGDLKISNVRVAGGPYVCEAVDALSVGDLFYTDRTYTFSAVPDAYLGLPYIRTANNFNNHPGGGLSISFDIGVPAYIYIGWPADGRMQGWVTAGYERTPQQQIGGSWRRTFPIYRSKTPHPAGTVTIPYPRGLPTLYTIILEPVGK